MSWKGLTLVRSLNRCSSKIWSHSNIQRAFFQIRSFGSKLNQKFPMWSDRLQTTKNSWNRTFWMEFNHRKILIRWISQKCLLFRTISALCTSIRKLFKKLSEEAPLWSRCKIWRPLSIIRWGKSHNKSKQVWQVISIRPQQKTNSRWFCFSIQFLIRC